MSRWTPLLPPLGRVDEPSANDLALEGAAPSAPHPADANQGGRPFARRETFLVMQQRRAAPTERRPPGLASALGSRGTLAALALAALLGCGADGAPQYGGGPPSVAATYGQCSFCHDPVAAPMFALGGHGSLAVNCERCHDQDLTPGRVGPDHRNVPACADCHADEMTHQDPAAGTPAECLQCHTPHGSPNLFLVNMEITDPDGIVHDVDFTNLRGLADGGFASASDPGTGLCEVCHTTTVYYRNDGTGRAHFTNTCVVCHTHATGFVALF